MLVLQRKPSESIIFRDRVTKAFIASVQVLRVAGGRVRLGSDADQSIEIMRNEQPEYEMPPPPDWRT